MKADFGWMIAIGLVAAVIGMLIAGPLYGSFISRFVNWPMPPEENEPTLTKGNLPSFGFSLALVLCPLVLVGMKTIGARLVTLVRRCSSGWSLSATRSPPSCWPV